MTRKSISNFATQFWVDMKLLQIPTNVTDQVWGAVEPFLARAVEFSRGTHTVEAAREKVRRNAAQLWVVIEDEKPHKIRAAGITSIVDYPSGMRAVKIELLAGDDMKTWFELKNEIEEWAKQNGCSTCLFWARKGWAKWLPDFQISHYVMVKSLEGASVQ